MCRFDKLAAAPYCMSVALKVVHRRWISRYVTSIGDEEIFVIGSQSGIHWDQVERYFFSNWTSVYVACMGIDRRDIGTGMRAFLPLTPHSDE